MALSHSKLCNLEDFADPDLRERMRALFPGEIGRFGERFPTGREYRKYWEVAMAARALEELGALGERAEVLGVGAGHEATIFWLTRKAARVFATDLYLADSVWGADAEASMLADPGRFSAGVEWNPKRLVVQHMDALELGYEDESFDGIFSSSSIEHFGGLNEARRSIEEMHRVLRPGGVLSLATEFRLEGPSPGPQGILMFDEDQLWELFVTGLDWEPDSELDLSLSEATRLTEQPHADADIHRLAHAQAWRPYGGIPELLRYPMLVLRDGPYLWTSVHLALRKRGRG